MLRKLALEITWLLLGLMVVELVLVLIGGGAAALTTTIQGK